MSYTPISQRTGQSSGVSGLYTPVSQRSSAETPASISPETPVKTEVVEQPKQNIFQKAIQKIFPKKEETKPMEFKIGEGMSGAEAEKAKQNIQPSFQAIKKEPSPAVTTIKDFSKSPFMEAVKSQVGVGGVLKVQKDLQEKVITPVLEKVSQVPEVKDFLNNLAERTSGTGIVAAIQAGNSDKTFQEAYDALKKEQAGDPSKFKQFLYQLGDSVPQTALGVALNFIPFAGTTLSSAYWTGLSASEQIQNNGKVSSLDKILLDVAGDRILGNSLEALFKKPTNTLLRTVAKSFTAEGGTEVAQDLGKYAIDYRDAKTPEEKQKVIDQAKEYFTSGQILTTLGVAGVSGAAVGTAGYTINQGRKLYESMTPAERQAGKVKVPGVEETVGKYIPMAERAKIEPGQVEQPKDSLLAVHNINDMKLKFADETGGIANPSIGIIDANKQELKGFGDISLIADRSMVEPGKMTRGQTFGADIYSPRYPYTRTKLTSNSESEIIKDLKKYESIVEDQKALDIDFDQIESSLENNALFKYKWLESKGVKVEPVNGKIDRFAVNKALSHYIADDTTKQNEYVSYIQDYLRNLDVSKEFFAGYTPSGYRRYIPATAENASKLMNKENIQAGEGSFYGLGSIRAAVIKRFKNITEIRKAKERILKTEDFKKTVESFENEFDQIRNEASKYSAKVSDNPFSQSDYEAQAIGEYLATGKFLEKGIFENVPESFKNKLDNFAKKLVEMPTEYFETKYKRPVQISEFKAAVVPKDINKSTIDILNKNGITDIIYYDPKIEGDRLAKIQDLRLNKNTENIFFYRPLLNKDIRIPVEQAIEIIRKEVPDIRILFTNEKIEGKAAGQFIEDKRLGDLIKLYQQGGKTSLIAAKHEVKHALFSRLDKTTQDQAYEIAKKEIGPLYKGVLSMMYKKKGIYAGENREKALLEEYIVDKWSKSEIKDYKKSVYGIIFEKLDALLKKIIETYKAADIAVTKFMKERGGSQKGAANFFAGMSKDQIEQKKAEIEVRKQALSESPFASKENRYLKDREGRIRELGDIKNPNLIKKIEDRMAESGITDPREFADGVERYFIQKADLKKSEDALKAAIKEQRSEEILNNLREKADKNQQKMIEFSEKYPKLTALIVTLSKEGEKGAIKGYKLGLSEGTKKTRTELISSFRAEKETFETSKKLITQYANNLPLSERGKLMAVVRDAKSEKDVIKAFARIDRKIEEVATKEAINNLKKTVSNISDSNAISADYKNKIKDLLSDYELTGHNSITIEKIKATQEYIDNQKASGNDVELPQRIIDKLKILNRIPKDQLTLNQIQGLQNEVDLLAKLGETKWAGKQAVYEIEKQYRKDELLNTEGKISSKIIQDSGLGKNPKAYISKYIRLRNYLQKTNIGLTPIEGLADITGMSPMKAVLDSNFGNYLTYNDKNIKEWYDLTKDFDETNFKKIGAYAVSQQDGGVERLLNSGLKQEEIDNIKLTDQEEKAYKFVREVFDSEFPAVKKYALDVYNKDVGEVKNYVSFMSDNDNLNELEMFDRFGTSPEATMRTKTVEQGFTEKRAATSESKIELNIDKIFRRHIDDVAYMLTMGRDIKQYFEIVNSPEMREKLGDLGATAWLQYLDLMARKGGSEGAKRIAILDTIRKNIAAGVLSFRVSSALVQFTSFADTMATMGAEWSMKGASDIATSKEWRDFVMDNFPEVKKAVGDDLAFREFGDTLLSKVTNAGLKPLQFLDGMMRSTAVAAAYQKLAAEKGIEVDLKNPNKELIQEATKLMRYSQGSSFFKDQPLSITTNFGLTDNKSLNKTILTFQSFMLARWDNMKRQIWRMGIKNDDYKKAIMSLFWMVIFAAAMEEGIRRATKWGIAAVTDLITGNETNIKYGSFAGNAMMNVIQSIPIAGSIASSMEYSSNPIPVVNTFEQVLSGASGVVGGKTLQTKVKGGLTAAGGIGSILGIPGASQLAQFIKGAVPPVKAESTSNLPALPKIPSIPGLPKLPKI